MYGRAVSRLSERAWKSSPDELMRMARRIRACELLIDDAVARRKGSPQAWAAWETLTREFHAACGEFYDAGPDTYAAAVRSGDVNSIERAVQFLELDPQCFRSGYAKERFIS